MSRRVALITEVIAPYRIPVFNALDELLRGSLHVFFISETEARRNWPVYRDEIRFRYDVLGGFRFNVPYRGDSQPVYLAPPVVARLERGGFDCVLVGGWNHLECYQALAWSRARRRRFVLWSETALVRGLPHRPVRNALKRAVVRAASAFAVPGPSAGDYLRALGAVPDRIFEAPNAVDNAFWAVRPPNLQAQPRPLLLFVGRLVESKGVDVALRAFATSQLAGKAGFLVAGDGPMRSELEALATSGVVFLGALDREELRRLYHSADLLVFPSRYDPWGLVLNEAACAGLPAIASDGAGATRDMIRDGDNGLVVEAGSVESLRAVFDHLAADPELSRRLRPGAAEIAHAHTPDACAAGLHASVS